MNIFYLDHDVVICAQYHNDKHVVKMIIEYAQLMSTAHRVLDGEEYYDKTANGRKIKRWRLNDDREVKLMKASHINHPSAVWVRQSKDNYVWLYQMWACLLREYTFRYEKNHACARLIATLAEIPHNLQDKPFTEPTPAMPDEVKVSGNSLASYRNYYINNKTHLASWKKRSTPEWYSANI
jgi:hypothetical protein